MSTEFVGFPKIPRLYKGNIWVTEKINGTNGLIEITKDFGQVSEPGVYEIILDTSDMGRYFMRAGSRNRWLKSGSDNHGFFAWVAENAGDLLALGEGRHFGEWWGNGIQHGYNMESKVFSLFNTGRWFDQANGDSSISEEAIPVIDGLSVVPVLYRGPWFGGAADPVKEAMRRLEFSGSTLDPASRAEGVIVYHEAANAYFKAPFEGEPKRYAR